MKCDQVQKRLDDLVDGLMADHDRAKIERHQSKPTRFWILLDTLFTEIKYEIEV